MDRVQSKIVETQIAEWRAYVAKAPAVDGRERIFRPK